MCQRSRPVFAQGGGVGVAVPNTADVHHARRVDDLLAVRGGLFGAVADDAALDSVGMDFVGSVDADVAVEPGLIAAGFCRESHGISRWSRRTEGCRRASL